jgi:hypothetical protein
LTLQVERLIPVVGGAVGKKQQKAKSQGKRNPQRNRQQAAPARQIIGGVFAPHVPVLAKPQHQRLTNR